MTVLPIAAPATPANGAATADDVASASGEFAALLAVVAGIVSPPADAALPEGTAVDAPEPAPPRGQGPAHPVEGPALRVPAAPVAVDASPVIVEAAPAADRPASPQLRPAELSVVATPPTTTTSPRYEAPPAEPDGHPPAIDRPRAEVLPPGRPRPAMRTVPASPVAVEASPALSETPPALSESPSTPLSEAPPTPTSAPKASVQHEPDVVMPPLPQPGFPELPLNPKQRVQEDSPGYRIPEKPVPEVAAPAPTPWPGAITRAEAPIPADAPAAAPPAPPALPEQIVSAVVPLHGRGDGRHEVTLELRPEELGTIRVDVSVEHQTVHLTLHAVEPATGRLLSAALGDLRSALADAGLQAGHVAVSPDGGSGPGRRSRPQTEPAPHVPGRTTPTSAVPATTPVLRPVTAGRLDLLL